MRTRDNRPVWLLAVDGVINVDHAGDWETTLAEGRAHAGGVAFPMRWVPQVVDFIRRAAESGRVRIVWCTTWCPYAGELERLWSLPKLDTAWYAEWYSARSSKREAAKLWAGHGIPVIWTDDEVARSHIIPSGLAIAPDPRVGLTPVDLIRIDRFIDDHSPSGS